MEELQDAIEDAQYVNAIATQEEGPRPVLAWDKPTEEQLQEWEASKGTAQLGSIDWTLSGPIGLYLFSSFVKTKHDDYVRINFCEEVLRFKRLQGRARYDKGLALLLQYLSPVEETQRKVDSPTNGEIQAARVRLQVPRTEIDEYDLERPIPSQKLTKEEVDQLMVVNMDYPDCSSSLIGLKGPVLKEVISKFNQIQEVFKLGPRINSVRDVRIFSSSMSDPASKKAGESLARSSVPHDMKIGFEAKEAATSAVAEENKAKSEAKKESAGEISLDGGSSSLSMKSPSTSSNAFQPSEDVIAEEPGQSAEKEEHPLREIKKSLSAEDELTPMQTIAQRGLRSSANHPYVPSDIFDQSDRVIVESLYRQYWQLFLESEEYTKFKNFMWYQDRRVVPEDFFVMRVLGRGGFGLVTACKKGTSGKLYAMKVMNKRRIKMKKSEQLALNERQALAAVESNFVVNLKYSFHSKEDVFLILDLMTGGDLGYHLHQKGRFPKKECQYYAARIMLGLQALHDQCYVYRDLKPENCLLAEDGRVKITDLGLATKITPTLHGAAGTRGYWAPEMIKRDKRGKRMPYGHTVDWFSFGCCVAEFISGSNPFRSEAALNFGLERGKQTKEKAIDCATLEMDPEFKPEKFEPDAADLCRRLLDKNERTRIGFGGCEEIMAHPWFKNVNWEAIISDRKRPPFIPPKDVNAASQSEIGTFAEDKAYQESVITDTDEQVYKDWDWTNPHAFAAEVIEFLIYERETGEPLVPINQHGTCCCEIL